MNCEPNAFQYVTIGARIRCSFGRKNRIAAVGTPMYFGFMKPSTQIRPEDRAANFGEPRRLPERRFWQAVAARDLRYDGAFVYAVRSTGVYCRPSCPSRRPRRERVAFFRTPEAAENEGFRPCVRCDPRNAPGTAESRLIRQACRLMEQDSDDPIRIASVARQLGVSPFRLQRIFRRMIGISPGAYARSVRLRRFKAQLREGRNVTSALYEAGYGSSSRLYEHSNGDLGMTPATYGRGGQGMEIGYTTAPTHLGQLLVAGTAKGVSAIYVGDSQQHLEAALQREYPAAKISKNPAQVSRWVRELVRHLSGEQPHLDLPLDVKATAFQRRVWEALQQIPRGSTRSYSDLARSIGLPKGQRAVTRACATNPAAILIPCHRVVREDGALGGYRWGVKRKQALLAAEAKTYQPEGSQTRA
jgi:AraC family transcriptional regulator, regulatory protein of adaptative response / methylated-DNA-[protein]-cysteine methyltransferase